MRTLKAAARQGNAEILYDARAVKGQRTREVVGRFTVEEALGWMLAGTDLVAISIGEGATYAIKKSSDIEGANGPAAIRSGLPEPGLGDARSSMRPPADNGHGLAGVLKRLVSIAFARAGPEDDGQEFSGRVYELSPFVVDSSNDAGYRASSTLAGTRLRTNLRDVGAAVTVVAKTYLEDVAAVDNETLLSYTTNTEVGGPYDNYAGVGVDTRVSERGNFIDPNQINRVRGLDAADNSRNYFLTEIPWDGYNVDRIDIQRGPNAILFGLGSPAGIVNATTREARFRDRNRLDLRIGSYGSVRATFNADRVLVEDELALGAAVLRDEQKFRQSPAYDNDERVFVAFKWVPRFLKSDHSLLTFKGNFEDGSVRSNRPRLLTPADNLTAFFRPVRDEKGAFPALPGVGGQTFDPALVHDSHAGLGNGQDHPVVFIDGGEVENPYYVPVLGNYGHLYGGPLWVFDSASASTPSSVFVSEPNLRGGVNRYGERDGSLDIEYTRMTSIGRHHEYAIDVGLPYSNFGQYKEQHLVDPTIFDFYNQLIDGPNKSEWADWDALNLAIGHTFLNGKIGYELSFFDQIHDNASVGITGANDSIFIDTNSHLADGSVNPNAGRAFVSDGLDSGNRFHESNRESIRLTGFVEHDFQAARSDHWLTRFFGRHVLTASKSEESHFTDTRFLMRRRMEDAYYEMTGVWNARDNLNVINTAHYLGDSLLGRDTASGAYLPNIGVVQLPSDAPVRYFDSTWNGGSVDPSAPWVDSRGVASTQSENPENYVGWTSRNFAVLDSLVGDNGNTMATSAGLARNEIESEAIIWQGYLWNDAIVGTYGWREDRLNSWLHMAPDKVVEIDGEAVNLGYKDVDPSNYNLDFEPAVQAGESRSWSVAAHVDRMLGGQRLPINLSFYYNESENFQPSASRVDMFGTELAPPYGNTIDRSVLLESKDGRYSLKITDYETSIFNTSASYIAGTWMVGRFAAWGQNWANVFEHDISWGFDLSGVAEPGDNRSWRYELKNPDLVYDPEFEAAAIADWRAFISAIDEAFPTYFGVWGMDGIQTEFRDHTSLDPTGIAYTYDAISKGVEYEFTAHPTENWRIAVNASRTNAVLSDVGGSAMIEWTEFVDGWLNDTHAGDIRIWSGEGVTIRDTWHSVFRSNYMLTELLEGTAAPELREWNFNATSTYQFRESGLNGLAVGLGYRWSDNVTAGYEPLEDESGDVTFDLSSPYLGPESGKLDFWISYRRKLRDRVDWKIQLNVRDAFAKKELIPITTQPTGTPAAVRIPGSTTWTLANSFEF